MTPEEKSLLERTYRLAEENNEILRSIRRSNRFALFMRIGYFVVIIGLGLGAYYFLQPYLQSAVDIFTEGQSVLNDLQGTFGQ